MRRGWNWLIRVVGDRVLTGICGAHLGEETRKRTLKINDVTSLRQDDRCWRQVDRSAAATVIHSMQFSVVVELDSSSRGDGVSLKTPPLQWDSCVRKNIRHKTLFQHS